MRRGRYIIKGGEQGVGENRRKTKLLDGFGFAPGWEPLYGGWTQLLPGLSEGAEEGILLGTLAQVCANRVHPDVPGDSVGRIVVPENVIVEFLLPESFAGLSLESDGRVPFHDAHELKRVALRLETLRKQVYVIGHQTVRVHRKKVSRSGGTKDIQEAIADLRRCETFAAL